MDALQEFKNLLADAVSETGADLEKSTDDVAEYMSARALHLSGIVAEPGFDQAVRAERDNVALFAGLQAADVSRGVDQRILGLIGGALRIAAIALV